MSSRLELLMSEGDARQQRGVVGELGRVLEGETGGSLAMSCHDQRRDLHDLAVATRRGAGVPSRRHDVRLRSGEIAVVGSHDRQLGVGDRVHDRSVRPEADAVLIAR